MDETIARLDRAPSVFAKLTTAPDGIWPEHIDPANCVALVPGYVKGAAVVGVGFGRGFISGHTDAGWSAPGAIALETGTLGVQLGAGEIDIVIRLMDRSRRPKLLSDRFGTGSDGAAAWGSGKGAHGDLNAQILFFGSTKGAFAGFGVDGATIKRDESGDKALYRKPITNTVIVNGGTPTPEIA
jgi:lipid-binding SYLF domain-containing protein